MDRLPLHPYDLFMLAVLVSVTVFGLMKGMAWQLASLASIALSVFVAVTLSPAIAPWFSKEEPWNRFLAMLTLYLATAAAVWLVFRAVSRAIDRVKLQEFDRQAGFLFGAAKGVLLCIVITFFAVTLSEPARQAVLRSRSGYYMAKIIRHATPVLPSEVREVLGKYIDQLNQNLPDPTKPPPPLPGKEPATLETDEPATAPDAPPQAPARPISPSPIPAEAAAKAAAGLRSLLTPPTQPKPATPAPPSGAPER